MRILNTMAARAIPLIPRALIRKISRRYIAGDTLADALQRAQQLHAAGFVTTLDVLGETATSVEETAATTAEYLALIEALQRKGMATELSIKPSALGLLLDAALCQRNLLQIAQAAARGGVNLCLDMEDTACTDKTLALFNATAEAGAPMGLALQAYLQRTYSDILPLAASASRLRICKGIYAEAPAHLVAGAAHNRAAINAHFLQHVRTALSAGSFVGIATHDAALIEAVIAWVKHEQISTERFEFQMLLGVCDPLRRQLQAMGFKLRVYVPYGQDWYGYSTRRIKENPRIAGYVLRALFRAHQAL